MNGIKKCMINLILAKKKDISIVLKVIKDNLKVSKKLENTKQSVKVYYD